MLNSNSSCLQSSAECSLMPWLTLDPTMARLTGWWDELVYGLELSMPWVLAGVLVTQHTANKSEA